MMFNLSKKIEIPYSYAYLDFVEDSVRNELIQWALSSTSYLKNNGYGRYFNTFSQIQTKKPDALLEVMKFIESEILKDEEYQYDPHFENFLSFNYSGARIHKHTDPNLEGHIHTRFNLILQIPKEGGLPIYNSEMFSIENGMLWRCEAGKYTHETTSVIGDLPRINLSYGFQIKSKS